MKIFIKTTAAIALAAFALANPFDSNTVVENDTIKEGMVADWERSKAFSLKYIDAMPEESINYKPTDDVRTFAQQYLHIAQGNIGLVGNATDAEKIYASVNLEQEEKFYNKAALSALTAEAYDWCIDAVKSMNMSKAQEMVGPNENFMFERIEWAKKAFEHQAHHRGQTSIYLRMKGIEPPASMLF